MYGHCPQKQKTWHIPSSAESSQLVVEELEGNTKEYKGGEKKSESTYAFLFPVFGHVYKNILIFKKVVNHNFPHANPNCSCIPSSSEFL